MKNKKLQLTVIRSLYGRSPNHKKCVNGLGLRRINQTAQVDDTPENRGMISKASYLLKVEEV